MTFSYDDASGFLRNNVVRSQTTPRLFSIEPDEQVTFTEQIHQWWGPPFLFIGTVYINGQPAPDGTSVSACGYAGTLCGYTTVKQRVSKWLATRINKASGIFPEALFMPKFW